MPGLLAREMGAWPSSQGAYEQCGLESHLGHQIYASHLLGNESWSDGHHVRLAENGGTPRLAIVLEKPEKVVPNKDVEIHCDLSRNSLSLGEGARLGSDLV